jgi:hypothetical protein
MILNCLARAGGDLKTHIDFTHMQSRFQTAHVHFLFA